MALFKDKAGQLRGIRFWCSTRRKSRPGCGKSHCIWLSGIIAGHSVAAQVLGCFLFAWFELKGDVLPAWGGCTIPTYKPSTIGIDMKKAKTTESPLATSREKSFKSSGSLAGTRFLLIPQKFA